MDRCNQFSSMFFSYRALKTQQIRSVLSDGGWGMLILAIGIHAKLKINAANLFVKFMSTSIFPSGGFRKIRCPHHDKVGLPKFLNSKLSQVKNPFA